MIRMDPHAISELYQHIITAITVIGPLVLVWGSIMWKLGRMEYKINLMWKAFCKQHELGTNGEHQ